MGKSDWITYEDTSGIYDHKAGVAFSGKVDTEEDDFSAVSPAIIQLVTFCYNGIEFLDGFLESLINQTLNRFDLMIIDMGSSDGSWEKIKKWIPRPGILLRHSQTPGISPWAALNKGIWINLLKNPRGWACPMNISDRFTPGALKTYLGYIETYPDTDLFYPNFKLVDDKEHKNIVGLQNHPPFSREALLEDNFCGCSPLIKGKTFIEMGKYDVKMGYVADYAMYLKMAEQGLSFHRIEEVLGSHYEAEMPPPMMKQYTKQIEDLRELRSPPIHNKS